MLRDDTLSPTVYSKKNVSVRIFGPPLLLSDKMLGLPQTRDQEWLSNRLNKARPR